MTEEQLDYDRGPRPEPRPEGVHYILSEEAEYDLRVAVVAMRAVSTLCAPPIGEEGPEVDLPAIGALFHVMAGTVVGLVNETRLRVPVPEATGLRAV